MTNTTQDTSPSSTSNSTWALWLFPCIALIICGWLFWDSYKSRGPIIKILFDDAAGLQAEKTQVRFRGVTIGYVKEIAISEDTKNVIATVHLEKKAESFTQAGTKFWLVSPKVTFAGISGLETLFEGTYIAALPGKADGEVKKEFTVSTNTESTGQVPLHKSIVNLTALVDDIVSSFLPALSTKNLELNISYIGDTIPKVVTDAHRLSQVLTNLISNAIKFSDHGIIQLTIDLKRVGNQKANLIVDIQDNGIGISEENQKNLFKPFSQGDSSIARKFGGTGLGLALSKRIIEAMDGTLELKSSFVGLGTHFLFDVPVDIVPEVHIPRELVTHPLSPLDYSQQIKNKYILLVEDSPDNAMLICHYIESLGAKIDIATDGIRALDKASKKHYDVILMDIQMPGMDGLEATRRLRRSGYREPIIAVTAHALHAEAEKSLQAGCNVHLTKPVTRKKLIDTLSEQLRFAGIAYAPDLDH